MTARSAPRPSPHDAYFLDIDGTIVAIADSPDDVRAGAQLLRVIRHLKLVTNGAVALISGRSLADIDRLFPNSGLPAAGQHGEEWRNATGGTRRPRARSAPLDISRRALTASMTRHPRLRLEDKGQSLALHYRSAPQLAATAHRLMRDMLALAGRQYVLQRGKRVVELRLAGRDKGDAIAHFMQEPPFLGRTPVFLGDDITDETGFRVVNQLGGHTIKVGPGRTAANWRLADAQAVVAWLASGEPAPVAVRRARERRDRPGTRPRRSS